jgi:hypothetical protein
MEGQGVGEAHGVTDQKTMNRGQQNIFVADYDCAQLVLI